MTRFNSEEIECPKCGHSCEFTIWESVNKDLSPDEAAHLAGGSLFTFTCPSCGSKAQVVYPCLYHDMERLAMVQLAPTEDSARGFIDSIAAMKDDGVLGKAFEKAEADYTYRIVATPEELQEKALILNANLDDRVVELLKVMVRVGLTEQGVSPEDKVLLFNSCEGDSICFILLNEDNPEEVSIAEDQYMVFANLLNTRSAPNNPEYVVNEDWALETFDSLDLSMLSE